MARLSVKPGYKKTKLGWIPEEWRFVEFDKVAGKSAKKYDPASKESLPCVELEHIEQETGSINGYVNSVDQKSIKSRFSRGEVLFGKLRPYLRKYWIAEFDGVCSSEIWVLIPRKELMEGVFLHALIQQHRFIQAANVTSGSKMPRADWDFVSKFPILVPPLPEQRAIAAVLATWDRAIDLTRRLIETKKARQKGLMQQLLSGKKRLDGFEGEWETKKLVEYFTERKETGFHDLPLLSVGERGVYPQSESNKKDSSNSDKTKYKRICPGDIGYNTMRMWQGRSALSHLEGVVSPAYTIVTPRKNAHSVFFAYLFKLPAVIHKFYRNSQGLVSDTLNCKFKDFKIVKVKVPNEIEEQRAIAAVLSRGEAEIKQSEQYLSALQQQKKGLMQKLLTGEVRVKTEWK